MRNAIHFKLFEFGASWLDLENVLTLHEEIPWKLKKNVVLLLLY
jgi:hypothetical protein